MTWALSVFCLCSFYLGGIHKLIVSMKALQFSHLDSFWPGVPRSVAVFLYCSFSLGGLHKLRVFYESSVIFLSYLFLLTLVSIIVASIEAMWSFMDFMLVLVLSI